MTKRILSINPVALKKRYSTSAKKGVARARRDGTKLGRPNTTRVLAKTVRELRKPKKAGAKPTTYAAIAKQTGLSIGAVWKILNFKTK